jgi:hypothetical protein
MQVADYATDIVKKQIQKGGENIPEEQNQETPKTDKIEFPPNWLARLQPFADAVGKSVDEVTKALEEEVGEPGDEALGYLADEEAVSDDGLKTALASLKISKAKLKTKLYLLRGLTEPKCAANAAAVEAALAGQMPGFSTDVLPQVADDESFVEMLKTEGKLKIGQTEVMSAVKAALADRVGLYGLNRRLVDKIEEVAQNLDEPAPQSYYDLVEMLTRRNYSEVFIAIGVKGQFATEAKKTALLARINSKMWESLSAFQKQLQAWWNAYKDEYATPQMMMSAMASIASGGKAGMGVGMIEVSADPVRDSAETVVNNINSIFAGTGIPVSKALAWDALQMKKILDDERLPAAVGAMNKEQMLKMLNVDVASDYVRLERNLVKYILSIIELPKVPSGQSEQAYLTAMVQLGGQIPWDKLMRRGEESAYRRVTKS